MLDLWTRKSQSVLEAQGLRLRLPRKRDFDAWQSLRAKSRTFLKPYEPRWSDLDLTRPVFEKRVSRALRDARSAAEYSFLIFEIAGEKEVMLGGITLSNIRYRAACHANLGYWMGIDQAGNGQMSKAVGICMKFAFGPLHLRRVQAACLPGNAPSRRVLEKNGFVEEGFAEQYLQIDGEWRDHVLYGLTSQRFATF